LFTLRPTSSQSSLHLITFGSPEIAPTGGIPVFQVYTANPTAEGPFGSTSICSWILGNNQVLLSFSPRSPLVYRVSCFAELNPQHLAHRPAMPYSPSSLQGRQRIPNKRNSVENYVLVVQVSFCPRLAPYYRPAMKPVGAQPRKSHQKTLSRAARRNALCPTIVIPGNIYSRVERPVGTTHAQASHLPLSTYICWCMLYFPWIQTTVDAVSPTPQEPTSVKPFQAEPSTQRGFVA